MIHGCHLYQTILACHCEREEPHAVGKVAQVHPADDLWGLELEFLRPGLPLVVLGQFSFIVSIATLTIAARLKRFDLTLEEAARRIAAAGVGDPGPSEEARCSRVSFLPHWSCWSGARRARQ